MEHQFRSDAFRFLIFGLVNTGLTFLVYQLLLFPLSPGLAYAGAWLAGLLIVAVVYPNRVFRGGRRSWSDRLGVVVCYLVIFLAGLQVLRLLEHLKVNERFGIVVVMVFTTALNFIISRKILRR